MNEPTLSPTGSRQYDAIVVGGGHNGLVNAAYLAKSGLRTLVLERRHIVGGAAITEELRPGFHFTTFSYALSLLRPDIIQDLDLVRHGYLPLHMASTLAPMENGDHLLFTKDRGSNIHEVSRHSRRDADAMDQYEHDITQVVMAMKPLFDQVPPNLFSDSPEDALMLADLAKHLKGLPKRVLHNCVRLLTGSAAEFLDEVGVTFDQYLDPNGELTNALRVAGLPATFVIDADGTVVNVHNGALDPDGIRALVAELDV
jgi:phytoene dehydrogenase-like protein